MDGGKVVKLAQRCIADVARHPVQHVDVYVADDLTLWHVALHYPESAPFVGGSGGTLRAGGFTLYASLQLHEDFPAQPPRFKFLSPWMNHQHLWGNRICHSLLSDDFGEYFRERRTHGTSMWNASCALADGEGLGGMPRYLQILRDFLASDPDYDEDQHVRYDAESLLRDVEAQRSFRPPGLDEAHRIEPVRWAAAGEQCGDGACGGSGGEGERAEVPREALAPPPGQEPWGADFFLKTALVPGDLEAHPCFDVAVRPGRVPALATTMTSLCRRSFEMGARSTDFGSPIDALLPHPCSRSAWAAAGAALARDALQQLRKAVGSTYGLRLPGLRPEAAELEAVLGIVGEIWKTTCIDIVKDEGYESERAMTCFVNLHFLLLFLAEEYPGLRGHAVTTARQFLDLIEAAPGQNLKASVPDLGRFLARFLLTEGEVPLRANAPSLVRELFSRNVRWVDPSLWAAPEAPEAEKDAQIHASFAAGQFGMKLTAFQSYYILRSSELGLHTLEALEACGGRPGPEALGAFQADCKEIKEMASYQEFFLWLQLNDLVEADIHELLCAAVADSEARGYNAGLPLRMG